MRVYGLTGNIACGKSLVERVLREAGVPVLDADQAAREVVLPGEPALAAIVHAFGPSILSADGTLDRTALGALVFADPARRKALEAITHPAIFARLGAQIGALAEAGHPLAVVSAALMVETGSWRNYEGLLVVTCPEREQRARLEARDGLDAAAIDARIAAQLPPANKVALADAVFDNGGTPEQTAAQVLAWLSAARAG